jgi:Uma2 family endonuclease
MTAEPLPDWFYPPPRGGWTADDLDRLPPSAPHLELIDGALIMMSPQTSFHGVVMRRLANAIEDTAPERLRVETEMTVKLGKRQRPEPDIVVIDAPFQAKRTSYLPEEVLLAVEIVSEESEDRDRLTKPLKYAQAGIRHFWRVENEKDLPVVCVYELDRATGAYVATGIHHDRLKVSVPFPMDIDLTRLSRR